MHLACRFGYVEIVTVLINRGADVEIPRPVSISIVSESYNFMMQQYSEYIIL